MGQCRSFKADSNSDDFDCLFTKKLKRAGGSPGGCYTKPTDAQPTPAPKPPNALPTPSPKHCRKSCANKFDRLKRGKGKSSYEHVCGLKNCKDCHECTVPPMVNFTVNAAEINNGCPAGCGDGGNSLCYDLLATAEDIAAETNLCTPMYYKSTTNDCPTGCTILGPPYSDASRIPNVCIQFPSFPSGSLTNTEAQPVGVMSSAGVTVGSGPPNLCTGPVSPKRVCFPTCEITPCWRLDFTSKVISRITKKGFWERHCQDACYEKEACGAYVYTRGTCKLYADLEIDQAQIDAYRANGNNLREIHNVKTVSDATGDWDLSKSASAVKLQRDRRITGVCGDPEIIRNVAAFLDLIY